MLSSFLIIMWRQSSWLRWTKSFRFGDLVKGDSSPYEEAPSKRANFLQVLVVLVKFIHSLGSFKSKSTRLRASLKSWSGVLFWVSGNLNLQKAIGQEVGCPNGSERVLFIVNCLSNQSGSLWAMILGIGTWCHFPVNCHLPVGCRVALISSFSFSCFILILYHLPPFPHPSQQGIYNSSLKNYIYI